jgi:hypothetical protein
VLAVVAAIALVLASAGVGAAVAIAVHKDSLSATTAPTNPFDPNNGFGNNPFDNGRSGSSGSQATGPLNLDDIAAKVDPALVNIDTTLSGGGRAAGSGMIISP